MRSTKKRRSRVVSCETFTTEFSDSPVAPGRQTTFPGASAKFRFVVSEATTTVFSFERLNASAWMIRTGRRYAGCEPRGGGVPEPPVAFRLHLGRVAFEHRRVETQHPARNLPLRVRADFAFHRRHHADRVVVLDGGVGIETADAETPEHPHEPGG